MLTNAQYVERFPRTFVAPVAESQRRGAYSKVKALIFIAAASAEARIALI